jgi:pantetheine-phosphate adenylyltransferase
MNMTIEEKIREVIEYNFAKPHTQSIFNYVIDSYNEEWRKYHNLKHLEYLFTKYTPDENVKNGNDNIIYLAIIYHDIIYYPWGSDNEEASNKIFVKHWIEFSKTQDFYIKNEVSNLILQSKKHDGGSDLAKIFNKLDMGIISDDIKDLMQWENDIYKEYIFASTRDYKRERVKFLDINMEDSSNKEYLIHHVNSFKPRVGYYAGSFNPFHIGHLSIVEQAKKMFDKVVIVVAQNPEKPSFNIDDIANNIFETIGGIEIVELPINVYLPSLLKERSEQEDVFLIRGVRNIQDWAAENNQAQYMKAIWEDIQIVYLSCPKEIEHVSSTGIRQMEKIQKSSGQIYIPNKLL